jgi:heavy-metal-associated domain-containing protein
MSKLEKKEKKRRALLEGFNNVPKLLEEARRAVDDVTQVARNQEGGGETGAAPKGRESGGAGRKRPKAAPREPREQSAEGKRRLKRPSRPPAPRERAAPPPAALAPDTSGSPQPGPAYCGITVKHAIPGRTRLRLVPMLHNETLAAKLASLLAAVPGIVSVEASVATGSLLITFSPKDLATVKTRNHFALIMHQVFPGFDTENLIKRMLRG